MTSSDRFPVHPPFDPGLAAALELACDEMPSTVTADMIGALQAETAATAEAAADLETRFAVRIQTFTVTSGLDLVVAPGEPAPRGAVAPIIFFVHGGGMIMGSGLFGLDLVLPWAAETGAVVVSPDYRLAPQYPDPTPSDDCWRSLLWTVEHATEIGGDAERILIVGHSAGAGLAAGLALRARDADGPSLLGQLLMCPMLDDRERTPSSRELVGEGVWDRIANRTGWTALLGERVGGPDVSAYAAPSRAQDLGRLAPAFIDVGSVDTFRDEAVDYASRIWTDGGEAELHVWPGAYHCFEIVAPTVAVSRQALQARRDWAVRRLGAVADQINAAP